MVAKLHYGLKKNCAISTIRLVINDIANIDARIELFKLASDIVVRNNKKDKDALYK